MHKDICAVFFNDLLNAYAYNTGGINMPRKILTSFLAVCMLLTTFVAVSAEDVTVSSTNENYDSGIGDTHAGTDITLTIAE